MALFNNLQKWSVLGYSVGKTAVYLSQLRTLSWLTQVASPKGVMPEESSDHIRKKIRLSVRDALERDAALVSRLGLSRHFLSPPNPFQFGLKTLDVFSDAARVHWRRIQGKTQDFESEEARTVKEEDDLPRYFLRNFHFQTDGYLSKASARRYEHQVELLFAGLANPMRRLVLEELDGAFPVTEYRKKSLKILEVGAGIGTAGFWVKLAYPGATLTVSDLSQPYLEVARQKLSNISRVEFVRAAAEALPFKDGTFDVVYSVFLFHELPEEIRRQAFIEMKRVLKPGGKFIAVDSLQSHDEKDLEPILQAFPRDYHEPFFRNYIDLPLEQIAQESGFKSVDRVHRRFLSRSLTATK
jgi:ubiquinone/menaquinone biosynthesis C-methylase UbiE